MAAMVTIAQTMIPVQPHGVSGTRGATHSARRGGAYRAHGDEIRAAKDPALAAHLGSGSPKSWIGGRSALGPGGGGTKVPRSGIGYTSTSEFTEYAKSRGSTKTMDQK